MNFNSLMKKYLWDSKPKMRMAPRYLKYEREVLVTIPDGFKAQGTLKDGIITIHIDAHSIKYD